MALVGSPRGADGAGRMAAETQPDVAVLDVTDPEEAKARAANLNAVWPRTAIVAVLAYRRGNLLQVVSSGSANYLFRSWEIYCAVREAVGRRGDQPQPDLGSGQDGMDEPTAAQGLL